MKKYVLVVFASLFALSASYSHAQTPAKDPVLMKFSNKSVVTRDEFEKAWMKGNPEWKNADKTAVQEYLELYIKFKRKVIEAEKLGLGDRKEFKDEFEGYRKQLAQPYLVEKNVQDKLIHEAYDRSKEVVHASHILINCAPDAIAGDTLRAYNDAMQIRDSIVKYGKPFEYMAQKYSMDPSAKQNKGDLGYFSAFDMVYPFETVAFNTPVGQVSMPTRSGFGYHIAKVYEKLPNPGKQTIAHIIIRIGPTHSAKDTTQAIAKINEVYKRLQEGGDFAELAATYSDDKLTAQNGGDLGSGRLIPEMENIKRKLGEGKYSQPFKTSYGWHIIKVTKVEPLKTFEEAQGDIKNKISKDARSFLSRDVLVARVKRENGYKLNQASVDLFNKAVKDTMMYNKGFWKPDTTAEAKALYKTEMYTIGKGTSLYAGKLQDYVDFYLKQRKGFDQATVAQVTAKHMEKFVEEEMLKFEEKQLPAKFPEYKALLREYRDGILLFTLTEEKVWRKAVEDTTGLKKYYEANRDSFKVNERVVVTEFSSESRATLEQVEIYLAKGWSEKQIDSVLNSGAPLNLRVRTQTYERGQTPKDADLFGKSAGYHTTISESGKIFRIMVVKEYKAAGIAAFDEVKPKVITKYQNYLEREWAKELESKYAVKVNKKVLETVGKHN
jgi:peptidyl-prolyl cis-trans isomerase SurA